MYPKTSKLIAEIGQNHNGSLTEAKHLVDMAAISGCYGCKSAKREITLFPDSWRNTIYNTPTSFGKTYYDHRIALELTKPEYTELCQYTKSKGLLFGSSFTDIPSLDFVSEIGVDYLKIASSRVVDIPLLKAVAAKKLPVILSCGMSTLEEISRAIHILKTAPYLAVLQCTACYESPISELHLNALELLKKLQLPFGLSSHSRWIHSALVARGFGAEWFEFHITSSRMNKGTDHAFALELKHLLEVSELLRDSDESLGKCERTLYECELAAAKKLRSDL